jgi:hypothetical protein
VVLSYLSAIGYRTTVPVVVIISVSIVLVLFWIGRLGALELRSVRTGKMPPKHNQSIYQHPSASRSDSHASDRSRLIDGGKASNPAEVDPQRRLLRESHDAGNTA